MLSRLKALCAFHRALRRLESGALRVRGPMRLSDELSIVITLERSAEDLDAMLDAQERRRSDGSRPFERLVQRVVHLKGRFGVSDPEHRQHAPPGFREDQPASVPIQTLTHGQ